MNKTDVLKEIQKIFEKIEISDIEPLLNDDADDYFWVMATSMDDNEMRKVVYKSDNLRVVRQGLILYLYIYEKNHEVKHPIWKLPNRKQQK